MFPVMLVCAVNELKHGSAQLCLQRYLVSNGPPPQGGSHVSTQPSVSLTTSYVYVQGKH